MASLNPSKIAEKWKRVTPGRVTDYQEGIASPKRDWADATAAAESTWKDGIQKASNEGRFAKGVRKAGSQTWQQNTIAKGANRWGEGVALAENKYQEGVAPYIEELSRIKLPQRFAKGDPRNMARSNVVVQALHKKKLASL